MMNYRWIATAFGPASVAMLGACEAEDTALLHSTHQSAIVSVGVDGIASCTTLYAGQHIDAGTVCVSTDGTDLHVQYDLVGGWELVEAHAWLGEDLADMPQTNNGAPQIGNFPYHSGDISGDTSYTFSISLESLGGEPYVCDRVFFVAAHAALQRMDRSGSYQTETGWADGEKLVDRGTWATVYSFTLTCGDIPPTDEDLSCDTAFAYGGQLATSFTDIMETPRWGWSNGPIGPGRYTFDIYAGAGQNDLSKGVVVGTLTIAYFGESATVNYNTIEGYVMAETHLYIGSEALAVDAQGEYTVAPGQFGNIHELSAATHDSFVIDGLSGDIYVVAHAVTCGVAAN